MIGDRMNLGFKDTVRYLIGRFNLAYFIIFKVAIPFAFSLLQIDYLCALSATIMGRLTNTTVDNVYLNKLIILAFLTMLITLPKFASFLEFIFHPIFIWAYFYFGVPNVNLGILALILSVLLIVGKILFYFVIIRMPKNDIP